MAGDGAGRVGQTCETRRDARDQIRGLIDCLATYRTPNTSRRRLHDMPRKRAKLPIATDPLCHSDVEIYEASSSEAEEFEDKEYEVEAVHGMEIDLQGNRRCVERSFSLSYFAHVP